MHSFTMSDSHCASDGLPALPLFSAADKHATQFPGKAALIDVKAGRTFTYRELLAGTVRVKNQIIKALGVHNADIQEQRIAYLVPSGIDYVQIQWGIWAAGGVAVPLCTTHPFHELEYTITNSNPTLIFLHHDFSRHKSAFLNKFPSIKVLDIPFPDSHPESPNYSVPTIEFNSSIALSRRALIIYTSGTTSRPKGCVTTHANIDFQANSLVKAWKYTPLDHLIHVLPLHHVHGIINGLTATLLAGGTVELHPKFDPVVVWRRWMDGDSTMFMAVPTVYSRLNTYFLEKISGTIDEQRAKNGAQRLRLTVSGSAALPKSIKQQFKEITGQVLLERYGMTEIGMGLSCLYDNSDGCGRPDGSVGWPLHGIEVRLVQDDGHIITQGQNYTGKSRRVDDGISFSGLKTQDNSQSQSVETTTTQIVDLPVDFQSNQAYLQGNNKSNKTLNKQNTTGAHDAEKLDGVTNSQIYSGAPITEPSLGAQIAGEIQIRGPNVFLEYWENPSATTKEFTEDGYFKTGDIAYRDGKGAYYIQGRSSVDIIKSGGYKISALDVEHEILSNIHNIKEAVVVGVPDEEWGERVAAVLVMENEIEGLELKEFRDKLRNSLAPYKIPTLLKVVKGIEKNAMGKVNKKKLAEDLWPRPV